MKTLTGLTLFLGLMILPDYGFAQVYHGYQPGIRLDSTSFTFAIWGDPQVGFADEQTWNSAAAIQKNTIVRERLQESIALTNTLNPAFVVTLGDNVHWSGEWVHYNVFVDAVQSLTSPLYLLMGNHDWAKATTRLPDNPFGTQPYGNFLWAQQVINGLQVGWYSFDAGDWHVVMWSQPGVGGTAIDDWMDEHEEQLAWLRDDLEANKDRPTLFFTHHPLLPVGRKRFEFYGLNATHRSELMSILTTWGNVKYVFYGHVHNTVASIPVTSWRYKDTSFILVPNAANTVRKADYQETYNASWGVAEVQVDGPDIAQIAFHTLAGEKVLINPDSLPVYDDKLYGYLRPDGALPVSPAIINGDFESETDKGWFIDYLLPYDTPPIQARELLTQEAYEGTQSMRLHVKSATAGPVDSRITAEMRQAIQLDDKDAWPELQFYYRIPSIHYTSSNYTNAYVSITGYEAGSTVRQLTLNYSWGERHISEAPPIGKVEKYADEGPSEWWQITPTLDRWTKVVLSPRSDYSRVQHETPWTAYNLDHLVITIGVATRFENVIDTTRVLPFEIAFDVDALTLHSSTSDPGPSTGTTPAFGTFPHNLENPHLDQQIARVYPSLVSDQVTIDYGLQDETEIRMALYDVLGRQVAILFHGRQREGGYTQTFDMKHIVSGAYFLQIQTSTKKETHKILIVH